MNGNTDVEKNCFEVTFLGEKYILSNDIKTFLSARNLIDKELTVVLQEESRLIDRFAGRNAERFFETSEQVIPEFNKTLEQRIRNIVTDLMCRGIHDVDVDSMKKKVGIFDDIIELQKTVLLKGTVEAQKILDCKRAGLKYAYKSAASNITGSGVRIYTNSLTSLMMHSAIENSILKSQARKADQQYETARKQINQSASDDLEKACANILFNDFFPLLTQLVTEFYNELFKNYLVELEVHGMFDIDNIEQYNENRSCAILNNISIFGNKNSLLVEAFEACPFNIDIYTKMIELNVIDINTLRDAQILFPQNTIPDLIKTKLEKLDSSQNIRIIKNMIAVLAYYTNQDEDVLLKSLYSSLVKDIKKDYQTMTEILKNKTRLNEWIKVNISSYMNRIVAITDSELEGKIYQWFQSHVRENQFTILSQLGLITVEDIKLHDSNKTSLSETNQEYRQRIFEEIKKAIQVARYKKEIYDAAEKEYGDELNRRKKMLNDKENELAKQGFFAFSNKKRLKEEIEQMKKEFFEFEKTEPIDKKNDYYHVFGW